MPANTSPGRGVFTSERATPQNGVAALQIKASPGRIRRIWSLQASSTINVYDSPTANTNLVYNTTAATAGLTFDLDIPMKNGIRVDVTAGGWMITWD